MWKPTKWCPASMFVVFLTPLYIYIEQVHTSSIYLPWTMVKRVIQITLPSFGALPCTTSLHEMAEQRDQVNDVTPNLLTKEETTDSVCFVSTLTLKVPRKNINVLRLMYMHCLGSTVGIETLSNAIKGYSPAFCLVMMPMMHVFQHQTRWFRWLDKEGPGTKRFEVLD
jgi:hypothetical protein